MFTPGAAKSISPPFGFIPALHKGQSSKASSSAVTAITEGQSAGPVTGDTFTGRSLSLPAEIVIGVHK